MRPIPAFGIGGCQYKEPASPSNGEKHFLAVEQSADSRKQRRRGEGLPETCFGVGSRPDHNAVARNAQHRNAGTAIRELHCQFRAAHRSQYLRRAVHLLQPTPIRIGPVQVSRFDCRLDAGELGDLLTTDTVMYGAWLTKKVFAYIHTLAIELHFIPGKVLIRPKYCWSL
jgi:hypothetical protein